jgi:hypothetical protein
LQIYYFQKPFRGDKFTYNKKIKRKLQFTIDDHGKKERERERERGREREREILKMKSVSMLSK